MKYLLHCIFRHEASEVAGDGAPGLFLVHSHGLAAAASWWDGEAPDLAGLLAYERSIAALDQTRTVIPLRFGCLADSRSEIERLLAERSAAYQELLERLEGHSEMGLRVRCRALEGARPCTPVARYLAAARRRQAELTAQEEGLAGRICAGLDGFYTQHRRSAQPRPDGRVLSLDFLVARERTGEFKQQVKRIPWPEQTSWLISGPWPPYHFVDYVQH